MQNVEIKAPVPDPEAMDARVRALGAEPAWTRRQRDVFFVVPAGYLKLRTAGDGAEGGDGGPGELIAYVRAPGTDPRPSDYDIAPVTDASAMETALARALGVRGVVEKTRRLFLWKHTRIHLDAVTGLGSFLELETVVRGITVTEAEAEVHTVVAVLALDPSTFLDRPYLELLEARSIAL